MPFLVKHFIASLLLTSLLVAASTFNPISKNELPFYTYKPTYVGTTLSHSDENSTNEIKYQLSFKYELFEQSDLFFAYTHKVLWSTQINSGPIKETNYAPELFYGLELESDWLPYIQFGLYRHESNGLDGNTSKQWDTSYIEPFLSFDDFTISYKYWFKFPVEFSTNITAATDEVLDYYGDGRLKVAYHPDNGNQHALCFRLGKVANSYAFDYQLNFSINNLFNDNAAEGIWNTSIYLEYFTGYGETLNTYNINTSRLLLGLSINR